MPQKAGGRPRGVLIYGSGRARRRPENRPQLDLKDLAPPAGIIRAMKPERSAFTVEAFRQRLRQLISPTGASGRHLIDTSLERDVRRVIGIIDSMTSEERLSPGQISDEGRRQRIAGGAGIALNEVDEFVKQFDGMSEMMRQIRRRRGR